MGTDPLSQFLQNGSIPVNYQVQPPQPQQIPGILDRLNPLNWFKSQLQSNPQFQQVMNIVDQHGGDAKAAFYAECEKRNANPDEILKQAQSHPLFKKLFTK